MKDLLDRYLAAVARELPVRQRTDITTELRDELLSIIEAREEGLGRPLSCDELEAVLIDFGNPLVVAGRYRRVQHLVGPEIFPLWWMAMKITAAVIAAGYVVAYALKFAFAPGVVTVPQLADPAPTFVQAFGWVTLSAVVIERLRLTHVVYRWRPRRLPPADVKAKSLFETLVEIGMGVGVLLWWTGLIHFRNWLPIPQNGVLSVDLAPVWADYHWPILGYLVFEIAIGLQRLARPGWARLNASLSTVRALAGSAIVVGLLQADHWVVVHAPSLPPAALAGAQKNFDLGMQLGLAVTLAILAIQVAIEGRRFWRAVQDRAAPLAA